MAKVTYISSTRQCVPGQSGKVYRVRAGEEVQAPDGELDGYEGFTKKPKPKASKPKKKSE